MRRFEEESAYQLKTKLEDVGNKLAILSRSQAKASQNKLWIGILKAKDQGEDHVDFGGIGEDEVIRSRTWTEVKKLAWDRERWKGFVSGLYTETG